MRSVSKILSFALICVSLSAQTTLTAKNAKPGPARLVVVGDSLSAGVQNFSLLDEQQPNGYASIIARQAGLPLSLPLVPFPGSPNVLQLKSLSPLVIKPADGTLPLVPRDNPGVEPTNIAIPGLTVSSALTLRPTSGKPSSPEQEWATIVLGFPNLPFWAPTEIELATALRPRLVIEWLGNNDALVPALAGQLDALTPANQFALNYEQILDRLAGTRAKLVTATIPDVTETAFFTSAQQIANQAAGGNIDFVTQTLGIGPNDYVRPSAQPFIASILTDPTKGPLPSACPAPLPDLGVATLPCVLTEADAKKVRARVNCYNTIIKVETALHGGVVVDINRLVNQIYINGYNVAGKTLTANFLGGLFSLDGIHPTNTGYGIIANEFIRTMNVQMNMKIPSADLAAILASDPLRDDILPGQAVGQAPPPAGNSCFAN